MTRGTPMREAMRPNPRLSSSASARETRVLERASNLFSLASEERLGRSPYHPDYGVELTSHRLRWSYAGPFPVEVRTEVREA